ncbi:MAG: hypothetical protein Q9219_003593 [cf. Caloplaca sp. 3 TL-2023]
MRSRRLPNTLQWKPTVRRAEIDRHLLSKQATPSDDHQHDQILPSKPTWSLKDLFDKNPTKVPSRKYASSLRRKYSGHPPEPSPTVSPKELHHLLRLSALPLPKDLAEQEKMQKDLQSQLHFVRAIQKIHIPDDVKPLQSIRDETDEGIREQEHTIESLADEFAKEEAVGRRGRIRKKKEKCEEGEGAIRPKEKKWDPLALAPKTVGRYIVVNTATD